MEQGLIGVRRVNFGSLLILGDSTEIHRVFETLHSETITRGARDRVQTRSFRWILSRRY